MKKSIGVLTVVMFLAIIWTTRNAQADAPIIEPISDATILQGEAYAGPTPLLVEGTPPVTWNLLSGPEGMAVDADSGVVSWPMPIVGGPYTITILAENTDGEAEESWQLVVGGRAWEPVVLSFESSEPLEWSTFPLQVTFTHPEHSLTLDGYWDGGNQWKVRFAPPVTGEWNWSSVSPDASMNAQNGTITVIAPVDEDISRNPNYRGHVKQSASNRHFEYADGTPFFWIGDTNWSLTTIRCGIGPGNENFSTYLSDRLAKKFTVIQTQYFSPLYQNEGGGAIESYPDNWYGLNPGYFQAVDTRLQALWDNGLLIAAHPTWFSEFSITLAEAKSISRYLWARYGAYNLVWSISGEYSTSYVHGANAFSQEDWEELGTYVGQLGGQPHPLSAHPRNFVAAKPSVSFSSSHEFHTSAWLDHNWVQSFFYLEETARQVTADYAREPKKPVIHAEGAYEAGYPASYNLTMDYVFIDDYLVRLQAWTAYLSGAAGHTYGANGVWPMYDPAFTDPGINDEYSNPWYEDLLLEGSSDMQHIRDFFSSLEWHSFEPMGAWLRVNDQPLNMGEDSNYSDPSALGRWGDTYIVYIPKGHTSDKLEILHLACNTYAAKWFNPRDGQYIAIETPVSTLSEWALPVRPDTNDWVLLLERTFSSSGDVIAPVIEALSDETINASTRYTGPQPVLNEDAICVTWVLAGGPVGMEIDAATGVVSWPDPTLEGSPHQVTIQANNAGGVSEQSWMLTVEELAVVVDDNDAGFSTVGNLGTSSFTPGYYANSYRYAAAGNGSRQATWAFAVVDGQYALSAQWAAHSNRASNATYQVRNNGMAIGTQIFDQRVGGGVFNPFGAVYTLSAGTLEVVLTDAADGYVIADAVQVEFVGAGGNLPPNGVIHTPDSSVTISEGEAVTFGGSGTDPDGHLPLDFEWDFGDPGIAAATVEAPEPVTFDTAGTYTVSLSVADSLAVVDPTPATVVVEVVADTVPTGGDAILVDDIDAGFSSTGNWSSSGFTAGYYGSGYRYAAAGSGSRQAVWAFTVADGQYALSAQWAAHANRASNATFQVRNNGVVIATQIFDQRTGGGGFNPFDALYTVSAGTLEVMLTDAADGYVIADAVQAELIGVGGNLAPNGVIDAPDSSVTISEGGAVIFSGTGSDPDGDLPLTYAWNFGDPNIADVSGAAPGAVVFDTAGTYTVNLTVRDDLGVADPTPATVVVEVLADVGPVAIIDDTDLGFNTIGDWGSSSFIPGYYGSSYGYAAAGNGSRQAVWTFAVADGQYALSAQWASFDNRASNATYQVRNNGVVIGTQVFDQRAAGGNFNPFDAPYAVSAGTLEVVLTDAADGYVIVDAVRAELLDSTPQ